MEGENNRAGNPRRHLPYYNDGVTIGSLQGTFISQAASLRSPERMWRLDEDPAQGIPDAGVALRGTHLCHSLGVYGYLLYTRRRHSGRRGFGACGDALGGLVGVLNLGYPLWLLVAVLVVLGLLTAYVLRGRVSDRMLFPLTVLLTPVCAVLVVAIAVLISSLLSPFYEPPVDTTRKNPPATTPEPTAP